MKRVQDPDIAEENGIQIASLLDVLASKLKTLQSRAEAKDYRDIVSSFDAGLSLAEGLGPAAAIYCYHDKSRPSALVLPIVQ
jgi:hypothetical protein